MRRIRSLAWIGALAGAAAGCSTSLDTDATAPHEPTASTAQALQDTFDYNDATMSWGVGYSNAASQPTGAHCLLDLGPITQTQGVGGQEVTFSMDLVESR